MKISITFAILAIAAAVSATGMLTTLAHAAAPEHTEPHGTGIGGGNGAFGEAGNFGGVINTPNGGCHTTGGPNNEQGFQDSC
jgi:hypothetical protein